MLFRSESFSELRQKIVKQLRNTTPEFKIRDFHFNLNFGKYKQFLNDFLEGKVQIDPDLIMLDTFAHVLQRPIVVLSSLEKHADNKVQYFGTMQEDKPPIVLGLYEYENGFLFMPFIRNKNLEFNLSTLKNQNLQIVAYLSKVVPDAFKSRPILDLEAYALMTCLHEFSK